MQWIRSCFSTLRWKHSPNWLRLTHFRDAIRKLKRSVLIFEFLLRKLLSRCWNSSPSASMVTRHGKSNRKKSFGIYLHLIWQTKLNCMQRSSRDLFFVSRPVDVFAYIFDSFSFSWVLCVATAVVAFGRPTSVEKFSIFLLFSVFDTIFFFKLEVLENRYRCMSAHVCCFMYTLYEYMLYSVCG